MRVFISVLVALTLGAPAALALPAAQSAPTVLSQAAPAITLIAKKQARAKAAPMPRTAKGRRGKSDLGGIHPLVGSGAY
ncbi:MAG: hypothetical protein QM651_11930 [Rhodoblastus sp.]